MDSTSPEGGYDGPDSETEAARAAMNEDLPAPVLEAPAAEETPKRRTRSKK